MLSKISLNRSVVKHGESVTIKHVSNSTVDEYGDIAKTTSSTATKALINQITDKDLRLIQAGARLEQDLKGLFQSSETIANDDLVTYQSNDYLVKSLKNIYDRDKLIGYEVLLRKEHD